MPAVYSTSQQSFLRGLLALHGSGERLRAVAEGTARFGRHGDVSHLPPIVAGNGALP